MRIIAGTARSLPLKTIEGRDTRPTTDKIKETLFNVLQADIPDCYFLDLFAGSGQIGLEAISRGADYCVFVENSKKAVACIEDNIHFTKFTDKCKVMAMDVVSSINRLNGNRQFDIIFMDPPYDNDLEKDVLYQLSNSDIVSDDTIIIIEASLNTSFDYLEDYGFEIFKFKKYKTNQHVFVRKKQG